MEPITVKTTVNAPLDKVWECWTQPDHITGWNFAAPEWQCPSAINDLVPNGKFSWRMEAKDQSIGFNYAGTYTEIKDKEMIRKKLEDGRGVIITFTEKEGKTEVVETFEPDANSPDLQRQGWQAILTNFKKYTEGQ